MMDPVLKLTKRMNSANHLFVKKMIHLYLRVVFGCDIMPGTQIGEGTRFPHRGLGVVINSSAVIGNNVTISKGVVIGGRGGIQIVPRIGNNVLIGANAVVIGPISIGNDAKIGAGAVVVNDVPEGATVIGNPAKIIKIYGENV